LIFMVSLSLVIHSYFIIDGFGESDAARLSIITAGWHKMGHIPILTYLVYVSPLYLHSIKLMLDWGLPVENIPDIINWMNVILGALTLIPLYYLWKSLSNSAVALVACLLYSFTPTFWQANIYGMPHLPSFSFFILSLLLFTVAIQKKGKVFYITTLGCLIFAIISVEIKADVILCFGAFLGICYYFQLLNKRNLLLVALIAICCIAITILHAKCIAPTIPNTGEFSKSWNQRWPLTIKALTDLRNLLIPLNASGSIIFFLTMASIGYCLLCKKHLKLLYMSLAWALPVMIFWNFRPGNNIRHLMVCYSVLTFLISYVFMTLITKTYPRLAFIVIVLSLNYFINLQSRESFTDGGRLIRTRNMVQKRLNWYESKGKEFASLPDNQKILIGTNTIPHIVWEVIATADNYTISWGNEKGAWADSLGIKIIKGNKKYEEIKILLSRGKNKTFTAMENWRMWTCENNVKIIDNTK